MIETFMTEPYLDSSTESKNFPPGWLTRYNSSEVIEKLKEELRDQKKRGWGIGIGYISTPQTEPLPLVGYIYIQCENDLNTLDKTISDNSIDRSTVFSKSYGFLAKFDEIFNASYPPCRTSGGKPAHVKRHTRTSEKVSINGKIYTVYKGPRGGKYVKKLGKYAPLSQLSK
jgi:hypothetical protein